MINFRACLSRLDELAESKAANNNGEIDDVVCMVYHPASYEDALKGMESDLANIKEGLDTNYYQDVEKVSSRNAVRSAANAAVQKALLHDVQMDNGLAVPSDAWLDHASAGLGVRSALEAMAEQRSAPLLLGARGIQRGEGNYQRILDTLVLKAENKREGIDRLEYLEGSGSGGGGRDDESVYSVTSQMSAISVASSTRMTAGQRRRHKQQQMMHSPKKGKSKESQMHPVLSPHPETSSQVQSAIAGRQQSLLGSQPHLCEIFHDTYGIGSEPHRGLVDCDGYSGRPPSKSITDLMVFNTARSSYGVANESSGASKSKPAKESGDVAHSKNDGVSHPVSPSSAARKAEVDKHSLAPVFKADASNDSKLDLPPSLPQEGLSPITPNK